MAKVFPTLNRAFSRRAGATKAAKRKFLSIRGKALGDDDQPRNAGVQVATATLTVQLMTTLLAAGQLERLLGRRASITAQAWLLCRSRGVATSAVIHISW